MSVKFKVKATGEGVVNEKATELEFSIHESNGNVEIWVNPNTGSDMFKLLTITKVGTLIHEDGIPDDIGIDTDSDGEIEYDYRSAM